MDIKGLGDADEKLHEEYFIDFLNKFFKKSENSSKQDVLKFLRIFIDKYKRLELDINFYREFKSGGKFVYKDGYSSSMVYDINIEKLDIRYNYNILISLVQYTL